MGRIFVERKPEGGRKFTTGPRAEKRFRRQQERIAEQKAAASQAAIEKVKLTPETKTQEVERLIRERAAARRPTQQEIRIATAQRAAPPSDIGPSVTTPEVRVVQEVDTTKFITSPQETVRTEVLTKRIEQERRISEAEAKAAKALRIGFEERIDIALGTDFPGAPPSARFLSGVVKTIGKPLVLVAGDPRIRETAIEELAVKFKEKPGKTTSQIIGGLIGFPIIAGREIVGRVREGDIGSALAGGAAAATFLGVGGIGGRLVKVAKPKPKIVSKEAIRQAKIVKARIDSLDFGPPITAGPGKLAGRARPRVPQLKTKTKPTSKKLEAQIKLVQATRDTRVIKVQTKRGLETRIVDRPLKDFEKSILRRERQIRREARPKRVILVPDQFVSRINSLRAARIASDNRFFRNFKVRLGQDRRVGPGPRGERLPEIPTQRDIELLSRRPDFVPRGRKARKALRKRRLLEEKRAQPIFEQPKEPPIFTETGGPRAEIPLGFVGVQQADLFTDTLVKTTVALSGPPSILGTEELAALSPFKPKEPEPIPGEIDIPILDVKPRVKSAQDIDQLAALVVGTKTATKTIQEQDSLMKVVSDLSLSRVPKVLTGVKALQDIATTQDIAAAQDIAQQTAQLSSEDLISGIGTGQAPRTVTPRGGDDGGFLFGTGPGFLPRTVTPFREPIRPREGRRRPRPLTPPSFPFPDIGFGPREAVSRRRRQPGYDAFSLVGGKVQKITQRPRTREAALSIGSRFVDNSPAASFDIRLSGMKAQGPDDLFWGGVKHKFRRRKTKNALELVEKDQFRIDSLGELLGITELGIAAPKRRKK